MGTVYLAEQVEDLRRRVALKLIRVGMDTREVIARFELERQALAMMNHPHIARVFDAGTTPAGLPFFAMEYVPGVPITEYCDANRLTTHERLDLFCDLCSALQHAHDQGIVHRDIKPGNVLVTRLDGQAVSKVIDFGVAKAIDQRITERTLFTNLGLIVGTPEYMSPEQAGMLDGEVTPRTDVYALGVLLYELVVGNRPFEFGQLREQGLLEMQRAIREDAPARPSTRLSEMGSKSDYVAQRRRTTSGALIRQVRGPLDWIVMRAMEKDPARRYAQRHRGRRGHRALPPKAPGPRGPTQPGLPREDVRAAPPRGLQTRGRRVGGLRVAARPAPVRSR